MHISIQNIYDHDSNKLKRTERKNNKSSVVCLYPGRTSNKAISIKPILKITNVGRKKQGNGVTAWRAGGLRSVSTTSEEVYARSAGGRRSVSTTGNEVYARSAGGRRSVSTTGNGVNARRAGGRRSVSTTGNGVGARRAGGRRSVSTTG